MGCRQSCTGGDADQSVLICTPRTMLLRCDPRKPNQSVVLATVVTGAAGVAAAGSLAVWSTSSYSGVLLHRQLISLTNSAVRPPVRITVKPPHASRIATTSAARRGPTAKRRVTTAHTTRA